MLKKIISLLLTLAILSGVTAGMDLTVFAEEDPIINPNYVMYQAARYSNSFQGLFGDVSSSYANQYFTSMRGDSKLMGAIIAWEGIHIATEPSHTLESGLIFKRDMYKLAIFDMLDVNNSIKAMENQQASYVFNIATEILGAKDIDISELSSFEVTAEYIDMLNNGAKAANMLNVLSIGSKIADAAANMYDAVNAYASYETIANMKNGIHGVLEAITQLPSGSLGENFDDDDLNEIKLAASECISHYDEAYDNILQRVLECTEPYSAATIKTVAGLIYDTAWDAIISAIPGGAAVLTAAKGIRALSNAVFELDDKCQAYYQLEADVALENAIRKVMVDANYDYTDSGNLYKAADYMRSVEMYKLIVLQGFDYSSKILQIQASAPATQFFDWLTNDYSECISLINEIAEFKANKQTLYSNFEKTVSSEYQSKYCPDYNSVLSSFNNQETVEIESLSLVQTKEINIGDTGYIGNYISVSKNPDNATEPYVPDFTSEDESVIKLNDYDFMEVIGSGECTITVSKGGSLEASITITVGSTPTADDDYDYLGDFVYSVNSDGETVTVTGYNGTATNLIIPGSIAGKTVTAIGSKAFYECTNLTSVSIPDSITKIGNSAFKYCSNLDAVHISDLAAWCNIYFYYDYSNPLYYAKNLYINGTLATDIIIPAGVTIIGNYAFQNCTSLTSIIIPDSVTSIGNSTFSHCTSLTSVNIPDSVTSIGYWVFYNCTSLTSIIIPDSVTSITAYAFYYCSSLTSVTIPDSVTSIGDYAFSHCSSLTSATIPNSVTSIGNSTFSHCTSLTSVNIPAGVTSLKDTFVGCYNLTAVYISDLTAWCNIDFYSYNSNPLSYANNLYINDSLATDITIPESVTGIGAYAFYGCSSLTSVTIPNSVTSIGDSAFYYCSSLTSITIPVGVTSLKDAFVACKSLTAVYISDLAAWCNIDFYSYGSNPLYYANNLYINDSLATDIRIPESVTSIGDYTFYYCSSLTSVTIPDSVTSIGDYAFSDCSNLTSVTISNSVTSIGDYAFSDCLSLTSMTIPDSVTSIGDYAFSDCSNLTSVTISNSVTSIGDYAFYYCSNLISVTIPNSVTSIGDYAFSDCSSLTSVTIPNSVTSIGDYAFKNCLNLAAVYISDLAAWCKIDFYWNYSNPLFYAKNLYINGTLATDIVIPNGVTNIGNYTFYNCTNLTNVTIPNSVTSIGYHAFNNCSSLTSINIPDGVTSIDSLTFNNCSSLTSVNIPDSVTNIGYSAFNNCSNLTNISIPDSVTNIGDYAFSGCSSITDVYYTGTEEEWSGISILSSNTYLTNATIHYNYVAESVVGDLNGDGEVSANDLVEMRQAILMGEDAANADMNGDGVINVKDLIALKKVLA